ncbi:hypothetical protein ONZ43_g2626 [Nemania bipapillata]|uniref:Uncharacterized protein n=1 Tax=Nemania bipapillata TaxID=110536 RepID=A0ACC2J0P0_9PEZI|nr:hypothetical protein ONZ43_g2626 [Nemania bipapillata]
MASKQQHDNGRVVSRIELPDVDSNTLAMVLQFFYGGNYMDTENMAVNHPPSYVVFMPEEEIHDRLATLPCFYANSAVGHPVVDGDYDDNGEEPASEDEAQDEELDKSLSHGAASSKGSQDSDRDGELTASRFDIPRLRLLARDRFYRTAEKVLTYSPDDDINEEELLSAQGQPHIYRAQLARSVFDHFPQAVEELYETVPESDMMMRSIPPLLIAAGYNNNAFRDRMQPLLEKYPALALAVVECMRVPPS